MNHLKKSPEDAAASLKTFRGQPLRRHLEQSHFQIFSFCCLKIFPLCCLKNNFLCMGGIVHHRAARLIETYIDLTSLHFCGIHRLKNDAELFLR